jgi:hypothetical protein
MELIAPGFPLSTPGVPNWCEVRSRTKATKLATNLCPAVLSCLSNDVVLRLRETLPSLPPSPRFPFIPAYKCCCSTKPDIQEAMHTLNRTGIASRILHFADSDNVSLNSPFCIYYLYPVPSLLALPHLSCSVHAVFKTPLTKSRSVDGQAQGDGLWMRGFSAGVYEFVVGNQAAYSSSQNES